ncbi:hypothetical protein JKL81_004630 [Salmonella enterica]|uniref:Uncharacterized protein n=3 Tax=Salmonella enterica I TaxID=59201 RepID=A0A5Y6LN87_SALET|nr:hypothetical protein [Salmonella enterica]EBH3052756.1 hypothetical protein [Salmonella enterica subsp. enterica]EBM1014992.1 hypothetical protein [Salmonella enterica subsp. enterica serovar Paratyphi B]ECB7137358.1 hypothetical protein [Salmonella enterica subsp. enterica serovar Virchow]ECD2897332.1 hypothetical protein [Salmonella enterica subsp. enterica serovar Goverdhan]ECK9481704.1 hypothetical protein [Salmonella enterica subsp. enterica serovar Heidelberg str. CFSAN000578]ECW0241
MNQSVNIKKTPATWYALNNSTGPVVTIPPFDGSVYSDSLLVSSVDDFMGATAAQQLQDYLIYEALVHYRVQVCAGNSTFYVYPVGSKGLPKNCDAGYACIINNDPVVYPLKILEPGVIQANTNFKSICNSGYILTSAYGSVLPSLLLRDVPDTTRFHHISVKNLAVSITAPSMYGPSGNPVPSPLQTFRLNCNSKVIPVMVNAPPWLILRGLARGRVKPFLCP